jgi:wyosine [tRNA(Phe)-imidazoG37] synthetase (radical SAM superfamily)
MNKENKLKEWSPAKKWNPFNSFKLLAQTYRWRMIKRGNDIPQPSLVTVDPINICNQKCIWCNSDLILKKNQNMLSRKTLLNIADFLVNWQGNKGWEKGVEAICIAGGGEPLLNPHIGEFIEKCAENGIEVGVVTNGTNINKFIEPLSKCTWVGVSIDCGSRETMKKLKGVGFFDKTIENIKNLIEFSKKNNTILSRQTQGYGVSYKYLLHPENVHEIFKAAEIAKSIGCRNFHMRPAGIPWDKLTNSNKETIKFINNHIEEYNEQINKARTLEDDQFGVFGITHKFDNKFNIANQFKNCYAIFMTAVFMPGTSNHDEFNFGLCCDRRGDNNLILGHNLKDVNEIVNLWGSEKHWEIFDKIKVETCPRCTYQPHNQIYEHVISNDSMTYKFI